MVPSIVYEDNYVMVINKPPGWVVNESQTTTHQLTIQSWLKNNFIFEVVNNIQCRSGIVHRLDKDTSGCLIIAKTQNTFEFLQKEFKERKVKKTYLALLHGIIQEKEGRISVDVGRLPWNRKRFGVIPGGKPSETLYKVISIFKKSNLSLVEFYPKTGRTHQIRIHAKYIGHPILTDSFYAGRKRWKQDLKICPRLFLHASEIEFFHPVLKKEIKVEAKIPEDLDSSVRLLKTDTE